MDNPKRLQNEKEFDTWIETENGRRIYSFEIIGRHGWKARYLKEVDADEATLKFWQEIYDEHNALKEIDEEYPVDKGHQKL